MLAFEVALITANHTPFFLLFLGVPDRLASTTFMYLNASVNGLQGVFLLLVYCVWGKSVRQALRRAMKTYSSNQTFSNS